MTTISKFNRSLTKEVSSYDSIGSLSQNWCIRIL